MKLKPTIYVFAGYSGSGKDTAASVVDAVSTKFASPGKRALEFMLRIPHGALDDREYRQRIAPHRGPVQDQPLGGGNKDILGHIQIGERPWVPDKSPQPHAAAPPWYPTA